MPTLEPTQENQIIIVGAGLAGCTIARLLAQKGHDVLLLDARPLDKIGHRWISGAETHSLQQLLPEALSAPLLVQPPSNYHIISPDGLTHIKTNPLPITRFFMQPATQHLLQQAIDAGARFSDRTLALRPILHARKPKVLGIQIQKDDLTQDLYADIVIDTGGVRAPIRRWLPPHIWEEPQPNNLQHCASFQELRHIQHPKAATDYLTHLDTKPGETVVFPSVTGGFSVFQFTISPNLENISLLASVKLNPQRVTGQHILREFHSKHPWIGERILGGGGQTPTRRGFFSMLANGFAIAGDAAGHTSPLDATGVASALLSAQLLAQAIDAALPEPLTPENLWSYNVQYQRTRGAIAAAYDLNHRLSERLSPQELSLLFKHQYLGAEEIQRSLTGQFPLTSTKNLLQLARKLPRNPRLLSKLTSITLRSKRVYQHYRKYPAHYHPDHFHKWKRRASSLLKHQ